MSNKLTAIDVLDAVKAFSEQSESNIAFGVLGETEQGNISTFIKGEESEILALIVMQMAKNKDFKKLLFMAVNIYKLQPLQAMIDEFEQDT